MIARLSETLRDRRLLLALVAGFYVAVVSTVALFRYGGNMTGFLFIGPVGRCPEIYYEGLRVREDVGYDGQFFYYIARDPFVRNRPLYECTRVDAYRYQRFLYPFLSWAGALGNRDAIPFAMVGINLLSIVVSTYFLILFCERSGVHPATSLFYALSLSPFVSLSRCTVEPLYICFLIIGFYFYFVHESVEKSLPFFALSVFSKELALGSLGVLILHRLLILREWKKTWLLAIPFLLYAAWQVQVKHVFSTISLDVTHANPGAVVNSAKNFVVYALDAFRALQPFRAGRWVEPLLLANFILSFLLLLWTGLRTWKPLPWIGVLFSLLIVAFSFPPNGTDFWGYGRHIAEVGVCALLTFILDRRRVLRIPLILNAAALGFLLLSF